MKRALMVVTGLLLIAGSVFGAAKVGVLDFDFIAPSVPDTSAAPNQVGLIIYDTGTNQFFGRTGLSSPNDWKQLSNDPENVYHKVSSYLSSSQSVSGGYPPTRIVFNNEIVDTDNEFNTSTGVWTAKHDGYVAVTASLRLEPGTGAGAKAIHLYKDGAAYKASPVTSVPGALGIYMNLSLGVIPVTVGTTLEIRVSHEEMSALNVLGDSVDYNDATFFSVNYIP